MDNIYELISGLALFSGATKEKILEIAGTTKFHFLKYLEGETVVKPGDQCTHLKFIISGKVRSSITSADGRFVVSQTLTAPNVIAPDYIFGRHTEYPCSVAAIEPTSILQIEKMEYLKILNSDRIFLINYLNYISRNAQKGVDGVLAVATGSLEERIAVWIICMTQSGATDVELVCRQRDLYSLFGVQRSSFIGVLDSMAARNLIKYTNDRIIVIDRPGLIDVMHPRID